MADSPLASFTNKPVPDATDLFYGVASPFTAGNDFNVSFSQFGAALSVSNLIGGAASGTGNIVRVTSATLVTPNLGVPTSLTLTNATNLPIAGIGATGTPSSTTFLRGDGTWSTVGTGNVVGPASATDNAIARFDTTTGKLIQNSQVIIDDGGNIDQASAVLGKTDSALQIVAQNSAASAGVQVIIQAGSAGASSGNANGGGVRLNLGDRNGSGTRGVLTISDAAKVATVSLATMTAGRTFTLPDVAGEFTVLGNTTTGTGNLVRDTSPTLVTPNIGTPSAGVATNLTGTASGLTAGTVTTNANLTGDVTSVGNATTIGAGKVTEAMQVLADVTTGNVSTTKHGYAPKAPNDATLFLNGTGVYSTPAGGGSATFIGLTDVPATYAGQGTKSVRVNAGETALEFFVPSGGGGGDALTSNPLSQFAATTSLQLLGVMSDETGTGALVFANSPALVTPTGIVKGDVGLGNVDNTTDAAKNSAIATLTNKTLTSPVINTPTGIVKADVGLGNVDNTSDATKNSATATLTNKTLTSPVINTPTGIVKADVGLGNVDNTSDATKNSATATLTNKTLVAPDLGTPSAGVMTNVTGTAAGLTAGAVTLPASLGASTATTQSPADNSTKVATTAYVDNAVLGQNFKAAAKYATTAALPAIIYANGTAGAGATLTGVSVGALSVDGSAPSVGDRILVKNQTSTFQNGIYTVTIVGSGAAVFVLTRATDSDQSGEWNTGDSLFVTTGTANSATTWAYNGVNAPTMGTTAITFVQTAGQGSLTSGNGIAITGNSVAIDTAVTVDKTTAQTLTNKTLTSPAITTPTGIVKGDVGLSAVTNDAQLKASDLDTDGTLAANSDTKVASQKAVKTYADTKVPTNGALGTPTSGTLTNATGLPIAGLVASTSTAIGVGSIELGHATDTTLSRSSAGVLAVEGVVIPSISSTNTFTNKRMSPRNGTTTSSATPSVNSDNVDFYSITALTVDITSFTTNLLGTPTEGQTLWIAITGTAARAITWGTSFEASTVALPTTTVTTARLDIGFVWNTVTSKWRCIAAA